MKNLTKKKVMIAVAMALCLGMNSAEAKVKLPAVISDGMVIQRGRPVTLWGTADEGEVVNISFLKKKYSVTADGEGRWSVTLPAQKPGGPYQLTVNDETLNDILIGDVWLCSGQSNMELPVRRVTDMFADEIASYENSKIRQFRVPYGYDFHAPQSDINGQAAWCEVKQPEVMEFSALAYFFAKAMYEKTGVPVGLVNSSWGGTCVECWISEESLAKFPKYIHDKWRYEDDNYVKSVKELENYSFRQWNNALWRGDSGMHETPTWFAADYDDSAWSDVDMFSRAWASDGLNPINGSHWFRKSVEIPDSWSGKDATLRLGCIVDADSVYVNGVFVGNITYQYPPRIYKVPAGLLHGGKNIITVRLISNGGFASFVKEKPYKLICEGEEVSLEGNWKHRVGCEMPSSPSTTFFNYKPVGLYNSMIAPIERFAFNGVVWYQGESNVSNRNEYADMLTTLIADWRTHFADEELPFYIVELADFLSHDDVGGRKAWAEMRTEQAKAAERNERTTLIKNSDLGEWNDIHPLDKKTLGNRVAEAAWNDMQAKSATVNKKKNK
jgi:sialate O-acetylesterase